jgi:hypothetical protein
MKRANAIFTAILLVLMKPGRFSGHVRSRRFLPSGLDGGGIILHLMHKGPARGPFFYMNDHAAQWGGATDCPLSLFTECISAR